MINTDEVEETQLEQENERKKAREIELNDVRLVMSTEAGKNFLSRLLAKGHMFDSTFTGNSQGMFLEGERNLALWVLGELTDTELDERVKEILFKTNRKGA